jgi:hypothetical protein
MSEFGGVDVSGTVYVADNFTRMHKISGGTITTFAGASFGSNGHGLWPLYTNFDDPVAVAVDSKTDSGKILQIRNPGATRLNRNGKIDFMALT